MKRRKDRNMRIITAGHGNDDGEESNDSYDDDDVLIMIKNDRCLIEKKIVT